MTTVPGRTERSRTWFCLPVALVGIFASIVLSVVTRHVEDARIRSGVETQAARLAKGIEMRLDEEIRPLVVLALSFETLPTPSAEYFTLMAQNIQALGIPFARMAWEPRVPQDRKDAFEAEARASGLAGFSITQMLPDGSLVPVAPASEYFPIRLEAVTQSIPSALGFDVTSDQGRRAATDLARDRGEPVAVSPLNGHLLRSKGPVYLIYWPLYLGVSVPMTVAERQQRMSGYVTVLVYMDDLFNHAMRGIQPLPETIVFRARNPGSGQAFEVLGWYDQATGLKIYHEHMMLPGSSALSFEHRFTLLHQDWLLTLGFPQTMLDERRTATSRLVGGLGLLVTLALTTIVGVVARQAERDRTVRRDTEALMDDLEHANRALMSANAQLGDRERASISLAHARTRFLASASHDLRQPLHALALFTTALGRRVTDPGAIELVDNIRELSLSMQGMFTSLLDLSRLDTGAVEPRMQFCDLDALVGRLIAEYAPRAKAKDLSVRKAGRFPAIETDPGLLDSVLRNLIDNAIKFTDRGGVMVAGRPHDGNWIIEVWDTGPGIGVGDTDRIFEDFERLEQTEQKPGFGLGLPIVRKLCALIGASISVCSRPGHGSRFAVLLPHEAVTSCEMSGGDTIGPLSVGSKTILLVDDDAAVSRALSLELSDCGHRVLVARNAADALRLIQGDTPFDMAIMDLRLGGRHDGWMLAGAWRARRPGIPVVLMTGSADAVTLRRVRDSGLPTLFKPVAPDLLHRIIANPSEWVRHPAVLP